MALSPFKAPGPDGIPNVMLQKCADLLIPFLLQIYQAILMLNIYPRSWNESITVVIHKLGKPRYDVPKAFRPIALLNTMGKVLTAIIAEEVSNLVEREGLLPNSHFGGRPGRMTTDAVHLLTHKIKEAWRKGKVALILFLDVEGAFPNAVTDRVIHTLRRKRLPERHVNYVRNLLENRVSRLKFDDFTSAPMQINNGIGQGDPLSMILYIMYNADLVDIAEGNDELSLGFVDDAIVAVEGDDFHDTTNKIRDIMTRPGGALEWSTDHNSKFELSKLAVMHLSQKKKRSKCSKRMSRLP